MSSLDGKVALITGGARGQGRSHALRLAGLGAKVVVVDICAQIESVTYPLATKDELDETVELVANAGGKAIGVVADIRDFASMRLAVDSSMDAFGSLDIVVANAGICPMSLHDHESVFRDVIDVNLTGTQNTIRAAIPALRKGRRGGSIVITSSGLGLAGMATDGQGALAYVASKHAVIGLMRSYANFLAKDWIRVNSVLPSGIATPMVTNPAIGEFLEVASAMNTKRNALPVDLIEEIDISNAIAWLVSDEGRYVTGTALPVDAGWLNYG
jgi:SDR family mycofactocin-dependent oxidoreductase